jgi:hypothetical protein
LSGCTTGGFSRRSQLDEVRFAISLTLFKKWLYYCVEGQYLIIKIYYTYDSKMK